MLVHQARSSLRVSPWRQGGRAEQQFDIAGGANPQKAETEPPAERAEPAIVLAALAAGRHPRREPDLVACRGAIDTLKYKLQVELQFQFANDDHGRFAVTQPHDIAAANFTFDGEFQALKKPLHRDIQRRFLHAGAIADSNRVRPQPPKTTPLWG
ncbi:hypothetical protein GCM10010869_01920 [Mesorhizobium tianshanense]|nr:hypothetical protein GCM10010869_01920 [Mesorhizobium tianshanense]